MRWLLFISRVVLICNICFAISIIMRYVGEIKTGDKISSYYQSFTGTVIVLGFSAIILNTIVNIIILLRVISNKTVNVPVWLRVTNMLFLIAQFVFFFL
ncbi:MAG: hypothetical protein JST94_01405 [Bacteroidetes bacterium]|nr:hypothetical protein [Bacteroidota bacterium]MBS1591969.1 hypothetical protein [Bacteroidota bacterium]MBS1642704.1 hypothetical protein [Bacteroidota bacterium]MBS1670111.1 hypothetical protein [Bacteroidota bacterium]